jgi:hypothetical protein
MRKKEIGEIEWHEKRVVENTSVAHWSRSLQRMNEEIKKTKDQRASHNACRNREKAAGKKGGAINGGTKIRNYVYQRTPLPTAPPLK